MIRTVLSLYIALMLIGTGFASAAPTAQASTQAQTSTQAQAITQAQAQVQAQATSAKDTATVQTTVVTCALPTEHSDFTFADWAYVTRDENSTIYLRMDTIKHTPAGDETISCGDIKKTYTKHGLTAVYRSLKETDTTDDESLDILKQIDHAVMHISYRYDGNAIAHRLHQATFYNKSGNPILTLDFDDIDLQTGAHLTWTPVTSRMHEEIAIFCRLANG